MDLKKTSTCCRRADEFVALFNTILINVTPFFRDPDAWDYIRDEVIPQMLAERGPLDPIRVWSALGAEDFRQRVKIYATDVDEQALAEARAASYDA